MNGQRFFWALFLSACVGYVFFREWNHERDVAETGVVLKKHPGRETVIWISPMFLPMMVAIYPVVALFVAGADFALDVFQEFCLDLAVVLTIYDALLLVVLPLLRKLFSARACATLWVLPVFLYWMHHNVVLGLDRPRLVLRIPGGAMDVLAVAWVVGAILVLGWHVGSHLRFRRAVLYDAVPVADRELLALWEAEQALIERKKPIPLRYSTVASPMTIGFFRKTMVTLLPRRSYTPQELQLIFRHELRHVQRRDVDTKGFLAFCQVICWWNPLVWLAARQAAADLEVSCDEIVVYGADAEKRKTYAALLLRTAGDDRGFSTCLSASARSLQYRLRQVMAGKERLSGTLLLTVVTGTLLLTFGTVTVSADYGRLGDLAPLDGWVDSVSTTDPVRGYQRVYGWEEEALLDILAELPVTQLRVTGGELADSDRSLYVTVQTPQGIVRVSVMEEELEVFHKKRTRWYQLDAPVDWDAVTAALDYGAENPDPAPIRPDMTMTFHELDAEPMYADAHLLERIDPNGVKPVEQQPVSWGGVSGFPVTEAVLHFSYEPETWWLRVEALEGDLSYAVEYPGPGDYLLQLAPYSARYTVFGDFKSHRETTYRMKFCFQVELPAE